MAIFLNTDSVATRLGYGGVFVYDCVTNFLLSLTLKEFWKSANIWYSYGQEFGVLFFWLTVYIRICSILPEKAVEIKSDEEEEVEEEKKRHIFGLLASL